MEPNQSSVIVQQDDSAQIPARKINQAFSRAQQEGRGAIITYFMCGYPTASQSTQAILAAAAGGADIIELGIPFSDPLADGATIQHAGQIALDNGTTLRGCLEIAHQVASQSSVPLIFMGYYNPILSYGLERFCVDARSSGVSGLIIPDLPPEESQPLQDAAYRNGLAIIFLIPPTTPDKRISNIVTRVKQGHGGFIYCIALSGVTGSRTELPAHLHNFVDRVRGYTQDAHIPLAVGFGLSTPEHIATVTSYADGAIIGSALVNLLEKTSASEQPEAVRSYIQSLRVKKTE